MQKIYLSQKSGTNVVLKILHLDTIISWVAMSSSSKDTIETKDLVSGDGLDTSENIDYQIKKV